MEPPRGQADSLLLDVPQVIHWATQAVIRLCSPQHVCYVHALARAFRICLPWISSNSFERPTFCCCCFKSWEVCEEQEPEWMSEVWAQLVAMAVAAFEQRRRASLRQSWTWPRTAKEMLAIGETESVGSQQEFHFGCTFPRRGPYTYPRAIRSVQKAVPAPPPKKHNNTHYCGYWFAPQHTGSVIGT